MVPPVCVWGGLPGGVLAPLPARDSCSYVITLFAWVVSTITDQRAGVTAPSIWLMPSTQSWGAWVQLRTC